MSKVKLIPEQLKLIEERIGQLEDSISAIREEYRNTKPDFFTNVLYKEFSNSIDQMLPFELSNNQKELISLKHLLEEAEIVTEYDDTKINIGTSFKVALKSNDGMISESSYILTDIVKEASIRKRGFVSIASPLGKAVYNKQIDDKFSYQTPDGITIWGVVTNIASMNEYTKEKEKIKK